MKCKIEISHFSSHLGYTIDCSYAKNIFYGMLNGTNCKLRNIVETDIDITIYWWQNNTEKCLILFHRYLSYILIFRHYRFIVAFLTKTP